MSISKIDHVEFFFLQRMSVDRQQEKPKNQKSLKPMKENTASLHYQQPTMSAVLI
jgi:hypothetical protein